MSDSARELEKRLVYKEYLDALKKLTPREIQILKYVALNFTNEEIGKELCRSPYTIKKHRQNICNKLALKGKGALYEWCVNYSIYNE
ncbi:response regulator transcription factor [Fodinibius halophilus]|uniref:Response regulator transcription factor n=1 Tax=Fodinibius halophilus TaxID=1736908 RepID=A0A6M1SZX3_9BACT|nr:LuxR C-terminal-related transcriptional regulator [Fodinibius halophilus]NGP87199.1 response regulator transcription factor [Fodinibius halophilus]